MTRTKKGRPAQRVGPAVAIALSLCLAVACRGGQGPEHTDEMTQQIPTGTWLKTAATACADLYPDRLVLQEGGLYSGAKEPSGTFTIWDAGTFSPAPGGRVEISTANDAIRSYTWSLADDTLTFRDDAGCAISYRRAR